MVEKTDSDMAFSDIKRMANDLCDSPQHISVVGMPILSACAADKRSVAHVIAESGREEANLVLLGRKEASQGIVDVSRRTPEHMMAIFGSEDVQLKMVELYGSTLHSIPYDVDHWSPVHNLARYGTEKVQLAIIEKAWLLLVKNKDDWSVAHELAVHGTTKVMERMLNFRSLHDMRDGKGRSVKQMLDVYLPFNRAKLLRITQERESV